MKAGEVLKGSLTVALGGLISKIIGAVYRVPLTNLIGAEGIGLYQMVFPVYCAMLTFSSTGLPAAISKLVGENPQGGGCVFRRSLLLFGSIGAAGSLIMFVLGGLFAKLQGNYSAAICYRAMSPAVFCVSVISCVRGYFQGKGNMRPTAVSQITEQAVKTVFGLFFCFMFGKTPVTAAALASAAVTVSEICALAYMFIKLKILGYIKEKTPRERGSYKKILALTVPVSLTALMLPLGHFADSFIVINALGRTPEATALFGIYSGSVAALTGLPIALAYGAAVACVPAISRGEYREAVNAVRFTGLISIPFTLFFAFFAKECIGIVYGGMQSAERFQGR